MRSLSRLCLALTVGLAATALVSCGGTKKPVASTGGKITKVKYFHLHDLNKPVPSADPSVPFEREYRLYGAISTKERQEREGHYYDVFWKVDDVTQPFKVRLEYRQQKTGLAVKTLEKEITPGKHRSGVTSFEVNGKEYVEGGIVTSWRAVLARGKDVLSEERSYLWK